MKPIQIAIVGCGRMGKVHSQRIRDDGRGQVAALYDQEPRFAEELKNTLAPEARVDREWSELLADPAIQAVVIGTPTTAHYQQVLDSLAQGRHVFCEKPLADNRERIADLCRRAEQTDRVCLLGYQRRYWGVFRTLRREMRSGKWGRLQSITMHNVENWQQTIGGTWRDDPSINWGGFIGDAGSHKLDSLFYVTGLRVREVFARTWTMGSRVEVLGSVSAVLEDEQNRPVPLCLDFIGNAQYLGEDLHLHCERGDLMIRDRQVWVGENGKVRLLENPEPDSDPITGFLDVLADGAENISPFSCALPVYEFTRAILQSAAGGTNSVLGD